MISTKQKKKQYAIAIIGGGSFGTALSDISANNGHDVRLWMRSKDQVQSINMHHINRRYLPEYKINSTIKAYTDMSEALSGVDFALIAIPSHSFRQVARQASLLLSNKIVISTTKGIEPSTFKLMSEILKEEIPDARIGVLSGPNLAKEIIMKMATASVIASDDTELSHVIQSVLHCSYFRVYSNKDVFGVELAGALKNIYAIITGLGSAMKVGENTKSMLITRSLAEMSRFAVELGANPLTFLGLAGVGDLIATCASKLSRNYCLGYQLGLGLSLDEALVSLSQEAEGLNTLCQVYNKAKALNIYMPLVCGLYKIIFEGYDIKQLIHGMMMNQLKTDVEFLIK